MNACRDCGKRLAHQQQHRCRRCRVIYRRLYWAAWKRAHPWDLSAAQIERQIADRYAEIQRERQTA